MDFILRVVIIFNKLHQQQVKYDDHTMSKIKYTCHFLSPIIFTSRLDV